VLRVRVNITRDEQIEPAVSVVIAEGGARRPSACLDAHALGDVGERTVVIVAVEPVLAIVRDVQIRPPVVVVVAGGNSEAPAFVGHTGAFGDVRELEIAIVAKERGARSGLGSPYRTRRRTVDQVDVEPSIIVDIDQGDAAGRRLEDARLFRGTRSMTERFEARTARAVLENDRRVVDEAAGRNRTRTAVLDRREYARRARSAGGWRRRCLPRLTRFKDNADRQRGEETKVPQK
jgi:hypothetical protein